MIMDRKAAEFWWNLPIKGIQRGKFIIPPDVAYYINQTSYSWGSKPKWVPVTWKEVHKKRTEKTLSNLRYKRLHESIKPCFIWVFSHGFWLMGGYYCLVKTLNKEYCLNFRGKDLGRTEKYLQMKVMQIFPLCLPMPELFYDWMILFAKYFKNKKFHKDWKNQGIAKAYCKISEYGSLIDIASDFASLNEA